MTDTNRMRKNIDEQKKLAVIEHLWLTYFNDTLFAKGIITEDQHNRMRLTIKNRSGSKIQ